MIPSSIEPSEQWFLKHEDHQEPQSGHKGHLLAHRRDSWSFRVGGSPGQRCDA